MTARPPTLIIGMHRSGTSLVARTLGSLGLFIGANLEDNSEPLFFLRLNEWALHQCGGAWDNPAPIDMLLANENVRLLAADYLRTVLNSRLAADYVGLWQYLRLRTPTKLDGPWGWKDPRNTFTLPLWLEVFPDARIVHVIRHGVDVAQSLVTRSNKGLTSVLRHRAIIKRAPHLDTFARSDLTDSVRCLTFEGAFTLWEEYVQRAREHTTLLMGKAMEIQYEDFLENPDKTLRSLAAFCELPANDEAILNCSKKLNAERAFAYRANTKLRILADKMEERLNVFGY